MLRRGSRGEDVKALQRELLAKGINPGPVDGIFGPKTEDAIKRFQERFHLEVDGIAGPKTMAAFEVPATAAPEAQTDKGSASSGGTTGPAGV